MDRIRKIIACMLSCVLVIGLMPSLALAVDQPTQAGDAVGVVAEPETVVEVAGQEGVAGQGDDADETADSSDKEVAQGVARDSAAKAAVGQQREKETISAKQAIEYVYIESAIVSEEDEQHIVVGFLDTSVASGVMSIVLSSVKDANKKISLEKKAAYEGAALFAGNISALGTYYVSEIILPDKTSIECEFVAEDGAGNSFEVVSKKVAEALEESDELTDGQVSAFAVSDSGELIAAESVQDAIRIADPGSAVVDLPESASAGDSQDEGVASKIINAIVGVEEAYADAVSSREDYLVVALDPGHGGYDGGAGANGLTEKDLNLSIARYCRDELSTYTGVSAVMTRDSDVYVGLQERVDIAVAKGADVFVCLHNNSSESGDANGSEVWVPNDSSYNYSVHVEGTALGKKILSQITNLGLDYRGVYTRDSTSGERYPDGSMSDYYTVIDASRYEGIPGIIVEHAFVSNGSDASKLSSDSFRKKLGVADATGIASQYNLKKDSTAKAASLVSVTSHVSNIGWESTVYDKKVSGTTGHGLGVEAVKVSLQNAAASAGGVEYRTNIDGSWQGWASNGAVSGTVGKSKHIQAMQIKLTGSAESAYDIYYRAHVAHIGWLGWAKNGSSAGSSGYGYAIEALEVVITPKGDAAPGQTSDVFREKGKEPMAISYSSHVQNIGWQSYASNGGVSGTSGKALRLEGIKIKITNPKYSGGIQYQTHIQNIGWQDWKSNNDMSGTSGRALRLEAIKIALTGEMANKYDVYYRVHAQSFGWMGWAKNGESAGTAGYAYRLEAIQVVLVEKGDPAPATTFGGVKQATSKCFSDYSGDGLLNYQTHVENVGWQDYVSDGAMSGTSGRALRLEGIRINNKTGISGSVKYRTHVQNIGWQGWIADDAMSGTSGRALRLEAIEISLTGEMSKKYDIYYRVHAQNIGWMGWAKNGEPAGTAGYAYRLEGIQIVLKDKDASAPGATFKKVTQNTSDAFRDKNASAKAIMGTPKTSVAQMTRCFNSLGKSYPASVYSSKGAATTQAFFTQLYEEAVAEGVRPEILFGQIMHETGWLQFGGDVKASQCNFGGLGATGGGAGGATFDSVRIGLRAQVQHLKAYASTASLNNPCVDPRFNLVTRGVAPMVDDLDGRWAVPGNGYGAAIMKIVDNLLSA